MFRVTAYELESNELNHYYEIEHVDFPTEQEATDWAADMGYLDHHSYSVSIEDPNGTVTYL